MDTTNFINRHIGTLDDTAEMLKTIGVDSLDELINQTVPTHIRLQKPLNLPDGMSEFEYLQHAKTLASKNKLFKNYIGLGYYDTLLPSVILRNILENPAWYTSYTPYQAEISQGRLEALLNYQTVITDLTGMEIANSSLLDEATAASEAMIMMFNSRSRKAAKAGVNKIFIDKNIFPQTLAVIEVKAEPLGIDIVMDDYKNFNFTDEFFGAIVQYPNSKGEICDYKEFTEKAHNVEALVAVAADIMSLVILTAPSEWDADIVFGSTQRFGIPVGFGGPHAAYFAAKEKFKRNIPGRIIGISIDRHGNRALRMALQTREQHIKRERATSNICTAQALLATMAGMYAVYHGADGLKDIATRIHKTAGFITEELIKLGYTQENENYFDTLIITLPNSVKSTDIEKLAITEKINLNYIDDTKIGISLDEATTLKDINKLIKIFALANNKEAEEFYSIPNETYLDQKYLRHDNFLDVDVFKIYHSETDMMRYIKKLERKDFSLTHSMISLGSCTMKLNPASSMLPLSWAEFTNIHPFVPRNQAEGYYELIAETGEYLKVVTGFDDITFQPNSGAAGEYTGLMVIREYHKSQGNEHRNVVLIPSSAHGTNPASAVMAGMKVVIVACDDRGNIDVADLKAKAEEHSENLAAFMVTYPSTHGVFESAISEMTDIIHSHGGQVYMDGANMNAQVGLTNPATIGADVCHLNLHKTFAIPHGGGGPGVGPIATAKHLSPFLPSNPVVKTGGEKAIKAVSAAPFGSAMVLPISHAYLLMSGGEGLTQSTKYAILNANYIAAKFKDKFEILYTGENGRVAHEMIMDCRGFKDAGITEADIAKRLMDYGFHAPTLSFPVHGTLMIEPTESESKAELDRFISAMDDIFTDITAIREDKIDANDNALKNSPHTAEDVISNNWEHSYSREKAAFPLEWVRDNKFFPTVARIDDGYGDRNLVCNCKPIEEYIKGNSKN